jgi:hypothetical protein
MDDGVWVPTVFTKNRDRLLEGDIAPAFLARVLEQAKKHHFLSDEHSTVDGTLVEAWAGQKSFRPKEPKEGPPDAAPPEGPRNPTVNFHSQKRSNATHQSTTDPDARLCKKAKGHEARLAYMGHALMENRNGLVVNACVTHAPGHAEREAALGMIEEIAGSHRVTIGADKGYDTRDFVDRTRAQDVTSSRRSEHPQPTERCRSENHAAQRVCRQPASPQARRGGPRLDQDRRGDAQDAAQGGRPCRVDVYPGRRGVQPGPNAQPLGGNVTSVHRPCGPQRLPAGRRSRGARMSFNRRGGQTANPEPNLPQLLPRRFPALKNLKAAQHKLLI